MELNKTGTEGWRKIINPSDGKQARRGKKEDLGYGMYQKEVGVEGGWL